MKSENPFAKIFADAILATWDVCDDAIHNSTRIEPEPTDIEVECIPLDSPPPRLPLVEGARPIPAPPQREA